MATPMIDVQFKNPHYHNKFGLLGGAGAEGTIYVLPADTVLPRSAMVLEGVSKYRKENKEAAEAHKKAADEQARRDLLRAENEEEDEDEYEDEGPAPRVRPKEGKPKAGGAPKQKRRAR